MRKAIMIAGLVLAFGVLAPATALGKAGGTDRPISVHQSGTTVVDVGTLAFTTETTGIVSHMGKSTAEIEGVITPTGPDTFTIAGSAVIVAANGDELFGTFTGSGTNTPGGGSEGTVDVTYSGGTGRFTNASGTASGPFTQTPTGTTATFATDISQSGTISY
jgi:hypothetical protein